MIGPIHPGMTLREDFMEPYELSANGLSKALGIPQRRISEIVRGLLVAGDFDSKARSAARMVPNLSLRSYRIAFDFKVADTASD